MDSYLIVGNGIAGITAARSIAKSAPGAEVVVVGAEPYPYYQRPRLWELLSEELAPEALYFRSLEWYAQRGVQVQTGSKVSEILPAAHQIKLADGAELTYDRLLLATGGRAFVPPFAGVDKGGVLVLRSLADAVAIREYARHVSSVLVIGGGLLGLETARALLARGLEVTVLEFAPHLMPRQLDPEGGRVLQARLEALGLRILTGVVTEAIWGDERAAGVRLQDGRELAGELVLLSTGIRSRVELARQAGLEVNRGVVVNAELRTSAPDIYAAGDVAEFNSAVYGIIPAALEQAQIAAQNMVAAGSATYSGTTVATSLKIVDVELTCLGEALAGGPELELIRHSDVEAGIYRRLALRDGKLVGAILLGDTSGERVLKRLIASGRDLTAYKEQLQAQNFELETYLLQK
ncbi:MAG: FAD-dependent oxidoreductase [Chloroflexota bacterium]|nr:FAD-dependent oxidoreductase [Chloroflexota bacterium]